MSLLLKKLIEIAREFLHRLPLSRGKERERTQEMRSTCSLFFGKTLKVFSLYMHFKTFRADLAKSEADLAFVQLGKETVQLGLGLSDGC